MSFNDVSVVMVHGAWVDGSSWAKVIESLAADGVGGANEGAERSHPADHTPIVTAPGLVVEVIREAVRAVVAA